MHAKNNQSRATKILGIVNLSPESFSYALTPGSNFHSQTILNAVSEFSAARINILDIGAVSTRPGSEIIDPELELKRFQEFLPLLDSNMQISLDCFRHEVLAPLLTAVRPAYINDVTGLTNPGILEAAAASEAQIIVMHSRGGIPALPASEITEDFYPDGLALDLKQFFTKSINAAEKHGINKDRLILDPGLGFGKNIEHSFEVLALISQLKAEFDLPIFIGASRKSFLNAWLEMAVDRLSTSNYKHGLIDALIELVEKHTGLEFDHDQISVDFFAQYAPANDTTEHDELLLRDKLTTLYNYLAVLQGADYLRIHHPRAVPAILS